MDLINLIELEGDCWIWQGVVGRHGYGRHGRNDLAHRAVYAELVGPPPSELDHLCRVRRCVNPDHLEPVTHRANVLRGGSPAARKARQMTCIRGHALKRTKRQRVCLTCNAADARAYRARKRAET